MTPQPASVELFWLPLGAGDASRLVRWTGIVFEAIIARREHRPRCDLYHSALEVHLDGARHVIEMTPVWGCKGDVRGVMGEGPVGLRQLGRSRLFRYEVHRWADGVIPDVAEAVDSPDRLSADRDRAQRVLDLVHTFPTATWGRDEQEAGEMWNSNSLTSWLLANSGHDLGTIQPPRNGRAPGWAAGRAVAARAGHLSTARGRKYPTRRAAAGAPRQSVTTPSMSKMTASYDCRPPSRPAGAVWRVMSL